LETAAGEGGARPFRLGRLVVTPRLNRVATPDGVLQIEPKVMGVLLVLSRRPGEVATKDQLFAEVWPGVHVTDDVLVRAIGELRRVLGDPAVETIRGRGYRLTTPVVHEIGVPPRPEPEPATTARRLWLLALLLPAAALLLVLQRSYPGKPRFAPLTSLPGSEYDPAFSPDGTRVAFAWDGGSGPTTDLYVKVVGEETVLRLTTDGPASGRSARAPSWSPDGARIGFVSLGKEDCTIASVSALGGPVARLTSCGNTDHPRFAFSPDGRFLALSRRARGDAPASMIHLVPLGAGEEAPLETPGPFVDSAPVFSPDGASIAFERILSENVSDLYVVSRRGGDPIRVTEDNADLLGFAWLDATHLVFSSNRAGMFSLWTVASSGGAPTLLAGGGRKLKHPTVSRTGRVAYEAWEYDMNLASAPLSALKDAPAPLAPATDEWTFEPRFSPDGRRLVFVSTRSGSYELWTASADGSAAARLTSFGGPYVGTPAFAPDGKTVVFVARPHGYAQVYRIDAAGGRPEALTEGPWDAVHPSVSRDGRTVLFGSRASGDWEIARVPLAGGTPERVTSGGGYRAQETLDGKVLVFSRCEGNRLYAMPLPSGPVSPVADRVLGPVDWGVFPQGVYFLWRPQGSPDPVLARIPAGPGLPVPVPDLAWPGFDLSGDGSRLLYARIGRHESNLVLLSFAP
jgi:Tol biopolymer transport system component/DNA-binding winged helix-turn-helix (wHTH) protein